MSCRGQPGCPLTLTLTLFLTLTAGDNVAAVLGTAMSETDWKYNQARAPLMLLCVLIWSFEGRILTGLIFDQAAAMHELYMGPELDDEDEA